MWTFEHTETTKATPQAIWKRWVDVSGWSTQNPTLSEAKLLGSFEVGSKVDLKPKKGPKSSLIIIEANENRSWAGRGKIPLGEMRVEHSLSSDGATTTFTHRIVITGPLTKLFVKLVGKGMANVEPSMMQTIARQALESS
jgi:hypothetical protein